MKNKITLVSAFLAASSLATAEIVINDFLSFEGFVDMSYSHTDTDSDGSDNSYGLDQVEINWLFNFEQVSGVVDFAYFGSDASDSSVGSNDDTQLEQAYVTYAFDDGSALTAGRFQSMLGFEAFEPTGLYQYSLAYDPDSSILPGYSEGVNYSYESGDFFFGVSLLSGYAGGQGRSGRLGGSNHALSNAPDPADDSNYAVEVGASYLIDDLTLFLGGYFEENESDTASRDGSTHLINAYATYEMVTWLFAGEVNFGNSESGAYGLDDDFLRGGESDDDAFSALLMANYAYSEAASITARVSYESLDFSKIMIPGDNEDRSLETTQLKYTLAHGYAFTDNLFLVTEVSFAEAEVDVSGVGSVDFDGLEGAVELIFAF
ncbi:MAG: porin [Coraliomargaritaceae bacterium]